MKRETIERRVKSRLDSFSLVLLLVLSFVVATRADVTAMDKYSTAEQTTLDHSDSSIADRISLGRSGHYAAVPGCDENLVRRTSNHPDYPGYQTDSVQQYLLDELAQC